MSVDANHYNNPRNDIIKLLDNNFNEAELTFICDELYIEFADFEGDMLKRCQSLVKKLDKENRIEELLNVIEQRNRSLQENLENIRARLNEPTIAPEPPPSPPPTPTRTRTSSPQINQTHIIIAAIVVVGLLAMVFIFVWNNNRSPENVSSPLTTPVTTPVATLETISMTNPEATSEATSAATSAAEIIKPTIEAAIPEPTPTEKIEPTEAIVETAVPDPTRTTEPEPTETSIPIPTETPIPLPELGLLSTISREKDNQFMFYVPAGSFQMGASASDTSAEGDESPLHEVTLAAFWIDTSEVTNQQYQICIDEGPCRPVASAGQQANENNYPRVNVTWEDALTYCEWVDRDGTLPTEAQWEYAARGTDARIYPWGNEAPTCQRANYGDCNNYRPKPVESSPRGASWSGALDMSGNVYEWVSDWYSADFYKNSPVDQPINMTPSHAKVRRGGSYFHQSTQIRATNRDSLPPEKSAGHTGFRCVVNITD